MQRAALLSVTNKTGLVPFAKGLHEFGFTLLSTSGTAATLKEAGLPVRDVAEITGFPEAFDGRVKTLHPHIHGGILFRRAHAQDRETVERLGIPAIDLVVVNLYDFAGEAVARGLAADHAVDHVDIGGPAMLRAAAKNYRDVMAVCDPDDYDRVLQALTTKQPSDHLRRDLAAKVFQHTARYDAMIAAYLAPDDEPLPDVKPMVLVKTRALTYGENPHQRAALYQLAYESARGWHQARVLQGEKLSYNNLLDGEAALRLVHDFEAPTVAIIKHNNPCGVASGAGALEELFIKARACDPVSAFGGVVAANRPVTAALAAAMRDMFLECVIAPSFAEDALGILKQKAKLRLVAFPGEPTRAFEARTLSGAFLLQTPDRERIPTREWRTHPEGARVPQDDLIFAMTVAKHVRSNAIVIARDGRTLGIGAGQMSRVDSMRLALDKAKAHGHALEGAALASDGFFPFRDAIDLIAGSGITSVIQPGGSIRDREVIEASAAHGITLVMTGQRHFSH